MWSSVAEPAKKRPIRDWIEAHLVEFLVATIILDVLTLTATGIIAHRQNSVLDELDLRSCHNSGVLIASQEQQIQRANPDLYRTFLPTLSTREINQFIAAQTAAAMQQIDLLAQDCTPSELAVPTLKTPHVPTH